MHPAADADQSGVVVLAGQRAVSVLHASAQRAPGTLLAATCSPLPEPPSTMPRLPGSATVFSAAVNAERRVVVLGVVGVRAAVDRLVLDPA